MNEIIKILLIEDNEADARLLKEMFNETDDNTYELQHVERLSHAVDILDEDAYDLILLDLNLPDSHGFKTFSTLIERVSGIPIILLSGIDDEKMAVNAVKNGAQDYLIKGQIDPDSLTRSIRYAIERQRLLSEVEKSRQLDQHLAYHDPLTNLPNRLLMYDRLQQALVHAKRYSDQVAVLFLDLDGFKKINDTKGHDVGDKVLQSLSDRLQRNIRESDTIARLGGDEFIILLKGIQNVQNVVRTAQKILKMFAEPFAIANQKIQVTVSLGISVYPFDGYDAQSLVKKADFAMYRAKSQGRNSYQLFNASMDSNTVQRVSLENSLQHAVTKNELALHFQPQFSFTSGKITGLEALVRWQHADRGLISPAEFIPLAEETGLIAEIGEWVLRTACHQNKLWQDSGYLPLPMAVNLSAIQFRDSSLPEAISTVLKQTRLEPRYLMLEITESCAMQDVEYSVAVLELLKEMGVRIALDDFGTGYSSLNYLKRFPIDLLKIDKTFIDELPQNQDDASITKAIVALAHNLGMKVIAEGVETKRQLQFLRLIHCDQMQGFLFSRPQPPENLIKILMNDGGTFVGEKREKEFVIQEPSRFQV